MIQSLNNTNFTSKTLNNKQTKTRKSNIGKVIGAGVGTLGSVYTIATYGDLLDCVLRRFMRTEKGLPITASLIVIAGSILTGGIALGSLVDKGINKARANKTNKNSQEQNNTNTEQTIQNKEIKTQINSQNGFLAFQNATK